MSIKNSAAGGGSSACRLSWRIAVVLPEDPSGDVMQLILPSTSCWQKEDNGKWGFRPYIQMLASNNVSASRVITRMQFDTKSPTPKLLFSPVGAVNPEDFLTVERQGTSQAAEQAVKFEVYQPKEQTEVPAGLQPTLDDPIPEVQAVSAEPAVVDADVVEEPVKRETEKPAKVEQKDISNIINKWSTKA